MTGLYAGAGMATLRRDGSRNTVPMATLAESDAEAIGKMGEIGL